MGGSKANAVQTYVQKFSERLTRSDRDPNKIEAGTCRRGKQARSLISSCDVLPRTLIFGFQLDRETWLSLAHLQRSSSVYVPVGGVSVEWVSSVESTDKILAGFCVPALLSL